MPDPVPKAPGQTRRRNKGPAPKRVSAAAPKRRRKKGEPEFPQLPSDRDWHPQTVKNWEAIWRSPIARIWIDVDVLALERWASLLDLVFTGREKTFTHQEIRMLEDRFGLSPLARRRLQLEVDPRAEPEKPKQTPAQLRAAAKKTDARWLKAVAP